MHDDAIDKGRRRFMKSLALGSAALALRGTFAAELITTPDLTKGPFFPDRLPPDTDNDLLLINGGAARAAGEITHLGGRILDSGGSPIRHAVVEIWQVDGRGVYLHSGSAWPERRDAGFQGFGRFTTGSDGAYYFRTIKPVPYPGRSAPHIHFKVSREGRELLATQCYVRGHPGNERDRIYLDMREPRARDAVTVDFTPAKEAPTGELTATFDIVLGLTKAG